MKMKKSILIILILLFATNIFARGNKDEVPTSDVFETNYQGDYSKIQNDPFEADLRLYYRNRGIGKTIMLGSMSLAAGSFLFSSTVTTLFTLEKIDNEQFVKVSNIISYGGIITGIACFIGGFVVWKRSVEKYYDTIRLRSQYYNIAY